MNGSTTVLWAQKGGKAPSFCMVDTLSLTKKGTSYSHLCLLILKETIYQTVTTVL